MNRDDVGLRHLRIRLEYLESVKESSQSNNLNC